MNDNIFKEIIEEYEEFLQKNALTERNRYCLEDMYHLNEEKGVIFGLKGMCNAMFKSIPTSGWIEQSDGSYKTTINNINSRGSFLKDVTLNITLVPEDKEITTGAEVDLRNAGFTGNSEKLSSVIFYYTDYLNDSFNVNPSTFYESMWHELQHAYRFYRYHLSELKSDHSRKQYNGEAMSQLHYNRAQKFGDNVGKYFNCKSFFYLSDDNEINSHLHEMVPYLTSHKEIDFTNYKQYIDNIPGYNIVKFLKFFASYFYIVEQDEELRNELTRQCRLIFNDDKLTPSQCIYRTKNRALNSALYTEKQFYKVLSTTLRKLKRKSDYDECLVMDRGGKGIIDEMKRMLEMA